MVLFCCCFLVLFSEIFLLLLFCFSVVNLQCPSQWVLWKNKADRKWYVRILNLPVTPPTIHCKSLKSKTSVSTHFGKFWSAFPPFTVSYDSSSEGPPSDDPQLRGSVCCFFTAFSLSLLQIVSISVLSNSLSFASAVSNLLLILFRKCCF